MYCSKSVRPCYETHTALARYGTDEYKGTDAYSSEFHSYRRSFQSGQPAGIPELKKIQL